MENNKPNLNSTPNKDNIDYRELMLKYLYKWYWFLLSVVICFIVAFVYLKSTIDQYQVQSTILLRKDPSNNGSLVDMSMLEGLGISGTSKEVEDEIQVLSSKALTQNVIRTLHFETEYFIQNGLKYDEVYPVIPVKAVLPAAFNDTTKQQVEIKIKKVLDGFKIKIKYGLETTNYEIPNLGTPVKTKIGTIQFQPYTVLPKNFSYKIISYPIKNLTERYCTSIKVASVNKKSNAISITTIASNSKKAEVILNKLIELYNLDAVTDKNLIASNTATFVLERLKLIGVELQDVELNVENYKKRNKLTDISSEAEIFLKSSSEYDLKLANVETQLNLVSYIGC
jgi:tyrosine-protein kinase Etk/Wzc